ncbi:hypothetical protein CVT26_004421 [Gymnopilus dilepis]|uniref:Uncharacterized protein n=1 Tax=Gymnopilus dilepis TaxID=231916 RepID=A0A409X1D3_9AGAR|nr:hypothetical protein CVT26_004421 [Gymnopilus dilepis]
MPSHDYKRRRRIEVMAKGSPRRKRVTPGRKKLHVKSGKAKKKGIRPARIGTTVPRPMEHELEEQQSVLKNPTPVPPVPNDPHSPSSQTKSAALSSLPSTLPLPLPPPLADASNDADANFGATQVRPARLVHASSRTESTDYGIYARRMALSQPGSNDPSPFFEPLESFGSLSPFTHSPECFTLSPFPVSHSPENFALSSFTHSPENAILSSFSHSPLAQLSPALNTLGDFT